MHPRMHRRKQACTPDMRIHTLSLSLSFSLSLSLSPVSPDEAEQEPVLGCGVPGGGCRMLPLCACVAGLFAR